MKQIPYQHCELGSSSALLGWLADSCESSKKPSETAQQIPSVTTVSPPAPSPSSQQQKHSQTRQSSVSCPGPAPSHLLWSVFSSSLLHYFVI